MQKIFDIKSTEAGHAGDDKFPTLLQFTLTDGGQRVEAHAALLAVETGFGAEIVQQLGLVEVGTLGSDGGEHLLGLSNLDGLLEITRKGG